jgi:hypothetical protein
MNGFGILLAIGIAAAIFLIVYITSLERRKKIAAYAESKGWKFTVEKDKRMSDRFRDFKSLRRGHSRYAYNIMHGRHEKQEIIAFDYHYVTGHGKSRKIHNISVFILGSPLALKSLYIRPENIFDKVSDFFGHDDIDFESSEFSRKFFIKAPEKRWAYHVIHQQMMEYLMLAPRFHIQMEGEHVMVWRNRRFNEQDFDAAYTLIQGILSRLPEYLKTQLEEVK